MPLNPHTKRLIIGLTGGIASGKSLASRWLADCGARVIDCDVVAHTLLDSDQKLRQRLHEALGIQPQHGASYRQAIRERMANDPEAFKHVEDAITPLIRQRVHEQLHEPTTAPYDVVVIPLLVERQAWQHYPLSRVCVIDSKVADQRQRLANRKEDHRDFLGHQTSRSKRLAYADDCLSNTGSVETFKSQVLQYHAQCLQRAQANG